MQYVDVQRTGNPGQAQRRNDMEWMPIETAPMDRFVILTFNGTDVYTGINDNGDGLWYDGGREVPTPTHWMPLVSLQKTMF
jgi:hypothetical protein